MKILIKISFLFLLSIFHIFFLNTILFANSKPPSIDSYPEINLENTQVLTIYSSIVGVEYTLNISLPLDYHTSENIYPVQYILDGFPERIGMVTGIMRRLSSEGKNSIPKTIIVGIAHGEEDMANGMQGRWRDFSPYKEGTRGGEAEKYLRFLCEELIPYIESNYRVDKNDRIVWGHSLGGLFALYVLFNNTDVFNRYIVSSASLSQELVKFEKSYALIHSELPAKLFLTAGTLEDYRVIKMFAEVLESRNYNGLEMTFLLKEDTNHSTVLPFAYLNGIMSIFSDEYNVSERPNIENKNTVSHLNKNILFLCFGIFIGFILAFVIIRKRQIQT